MLLHILKVKWTPRFQQAIFVLSRPPHRFRTNNPKSPPHLPGLLAQVNSFILSTSTCFTTFQQLIPSQWHRRFHSKLQVPWTLECHLHDPPSDSPGDRRRSHVEVFASNPIRGREVLTKTKCWVEIGGAYQIVPQIFQNTWYSPFCWNSYYQKFGNCFLSLALIPPCWKWRDQSRWVSHLTSQVWSCRPRVGWWMTWCSKKRIGLDGPVPVFISISTKVVI